MLLSFYMIKRVHQKSRIYFLFTNNILNHYQLLSGLDSGACISKNFFADYVDELFQSYLIIQS